MRLARYTLPFPGARVVGVVGWGGGVDGSTPVQASLLLRVALVRFLLRGCCPSHAAALPAPAGADAAIVRRTQAAIAAAGEPAVHFSARFSLPSAWAAALFVAYGGLMVALARFSWGRALLLRWGAGCRGLASSQQRHCAQPYQPCNLSSAAALQPGQQVAGRCCSGGVLGG